MDWCQIMTTVLYQISFCSSLCQEQRSFSSKAVFITASSDDTKKEKIVCF